MFYLDTCFKDEDQMYYLFFNDSKGKNRSFKFESYERIEDEPYYANGGMGCSIRSLGRALDIDYEEAYTLLAEEGRFKHYLPNQDVVETDILRAFGFKHKRFQPGEYTFFELAEDYNLNTGKGPYVVSIPNHIFCIKNGIIYESLLNNKEDPYAFMFKDTISRLLDASTYIKDFYYRSGDYFA